MITSSTRGEARFAFMALVKKTFAVLIGLLLLRVGISVVYPELFDTWDNTYDIRIKRNFWGHLVKRMELRDGRPNGLYINDFAWGSVKGYFKNGIEVGKWIQWYPGRKKIRFVSLFADDYAIVTNRQGKIEFCPILINSTSFNPSGAIVGQVTNGIGHEAFFEPNGRLSQIKTYGMVTNYIIQYHSKGDAVGDIYELKIQPKYNDINLLDVCNYHAGKEDSVYSVYENGRTWQYQESEGLSTNKELPDFILGKSRYVIPRLVNSELVFDQVVFCSNKILKTQSMESNATIE